jgi:hypothetical protein
LLVNIFGAYRKKTTVPYLHHQDYKAHGEDTSIYETLCGFCVLCGKNFSRQPDSWLARGYLSATTPAMLARRGGRVVSRSG